MSVKNVVKVMNFHSLLRVNGARSKAEKAYEYEKELQDIILSIINNRIFKQEKLSIQMPNGRKELNIYIGNDFGFCSNFNTDIISEIKKDDSKNDKIIIGKKIKTKAENVLIYIDKEDFLKEDIKIYDLVLQGVLNREYSKINIIYIHYYNLNNQGLLKRTILPIDFNSLETNKDKLKSDINVDYVVEGNLELIIWSLISIYVSTEIKISEAWSWASENVKRQAFTNESLNKIEEREIESKKIERKEKKIKIFKDLVELNNRKVGIKHREVSKWLVK